MDLRKCVFKGGNLQAKVLAGALMSDADFTDANMREAVLTKVGGLSGAAGASCPTKKSPYPT